MWVRKTQRNKNRPSFLHLQLSTAVALVSLHTCALLTLDFFHFQIGTRFAREQDPLPYLVSQPLPWQVHSVSRRSSKAEEVSQKQNLRKSVRKTPFSFSRITYKSWLYWPARCSTRGSLLFNTQRQLDSACERVSLVTCSAFVFSFSEEDCQGNQGRRY